MTLKLITGNQFRPDSVPYEEELLSQVDAQVVNGEFESLKLLTNAVTGIYDYDEHSPYWLESGFIDPVWVISFKGDSQKIKKTINWGEVTLYDGRRLTDNKHIPLLNTFKYWVTAVDNPIKNGGSFLKPVSVWRIVSRILGLANAIILNGNKIGLSKYHLKNATHDFFMALMVKVAQGGLKNGIYDFTRKTKSLLLSKIDCIDDEEADKFKVKFPYLCRTMLDKEQDLGFSVDQRVKACCWLNKQGFYNEVASTKYRGNLTVLADILYADKVIPVYEGCFTTIDELVLQPHDGTNEFLAVPNADRDVNPTELSITPYIYALKLLATVPVSKSCCYVSPDALKGVSLGQIKKYSQLRKVGRTKTLPPAFVFNLIRHCYEFSAQHQEAILDSCFNVLVVGAQPKDNRAAWVNGAFLELVDDSLLSLGVNRLCLDKEPSENRFKLRRDNHGLFDLYDVLMGSMQILIGAIMARRQDELIKLKPYDNLSPNIDPASGDGQSLAYSLIFKVKKTGIGGKSATNATLTRPIPRSIALMLWRLEKFNRKVIDAKLNKGTIRLFNNLISAQFALSCSVSNMYNTLLDSACDYFETTLVEYGKGEKRRYYVRQHQLRRFFSMVFFWSKSFDGMETLRWMLGHSDLRHLYHYITESDTGGALKGVKASYLADAMQSEKLENIDELRKLIAKRYGVKHVGVGLSRPSKLVRDYDAPAYMTMPHIDTIKQQEKFEGMILELLEDDVITLEPEFFTVERCGEIVHDFNLSLQIKELD